MFNWFQVCDGTMTAASTRQTARATTSTACPSWLDSPDHLTRAGRVRSGEKTSITIPRVWTLLLSSFEIWREHIYKNMGLTFLSLSSCLFKIYFTCLSFSWTCILHRSANFQALLNTVDFLWSCEGVYHKQEICFLLCFQSWLFITVHGQF